MQPQRFEARETFRVSPEALWPLVADTPKLNRAIGMPAVEYSIAPLPSGGSRIEAQSRLLGVPIARWTEYPFRWEAPRGFVVRREFHGGLLEWLRAGVDLTPRNAGTEVLVHAEIAPRNLLAAALVRWVIGPRSVRSILDQCRLFESYLLGQSSDPFPQLANRTALPSAAEEASARLVQNGLDERGIELLRRHLAEARDEEVVKMRPFELADRWGLDRRETLALFLHATVAGLLVMTWDVLCPNCRIAKNEYFSLRDLGPQAHCEVCNVTFDAQFDRLVEVRFSVAPALRRVESGEFCIGGPMNTPHVIAQAGVPGGGEELLSLALAPGTYRLRASGERGQTIVEAAVAETTAQGGPSADELCVILTEHEIAPVAAGVTAGSVRIRIANQTGSDQVVAVEEGFWPDTIATAALVSTMQEFRDLFSSEVLAPGLLLGIENLAFMFTDLAGSTALYEKIGQARAFRLVQDHFRVLGSGISEQRGALVKTIGDAVMATFPSGADAIAAALQIQRAIRQMPVPEGVKPSRLVRIGIHQGPCVAVNLNDRLDYFGTTVNTAARIEAACDGGQIVVSLDACASEAARGLLRDSGATVVEEVVRLRGLAEPMPVYRITPAADPAN